MKKTKKLPKNAPYEIWDEVFQAQWFIFMGGDLAEAIASYNEHVESDVECPEYHPNRAAYYFADTAHKGGCIWFREKNPRNCIVAHECLHATSVLFTVLECNMDRNCEEVFAYYIQFLVDKIDGLRKEKKK